jgi:acyl-homoserine lactone acylase PvdQ
MATPKRMWYSCSVTCPRDPLLQMDRDRKGAAGRAAELLGSSALPSDVQFRNIGLARTALSTWQALGVEALEVIPGGQSGVFSDPNYFSQLPLWLTNDYHALALGEADAALSAVAVSTFGPGD